ncbi:MAG: hypothetical protein J0L70_30190 [Leptolyngbya sp. UWPOB_LEPTO1]|uniref:hypothetical protein n=1 Tax=Leptolyngbya sp. UWPOB_LEPTO1 TaxID=2815653 RepID=UPI001AC03D82|nr:hypothetical protein [Leptolyngbya sp. UWPOB_LEPTO1]MBN8564805.1 hypothetical protein [Leptolyngbya sp. UWPOB_LEPTO1]
MVIDTEALSARYRKASVNLDEKQLLITNFYNTQQENDLTESPNCRGFGRVRHFRRSSSNRWLSNPLPIDPACKALDLPETDMIRAQVFQSAACNWRCWYCYVPFELLAANRKYSDWMSPSRLIDLYLDQPDPPPMIDLTGGQPDLVPEWVPWMMTELRERELDLQVYLWSDDNLSNDYLWRFLSDAELELMASYPNYGRVCCFKGFNAQSFAFNTGAEAALFDQQFQLMKRLLDIGLDLYAYATFTSPKKDDISSEMKHFVDRLQAIHENLPLRTIPLEIQAFTPVQDRVDETREIATKNQYFAIEAWQTELEIRFSSTQRAESIADILL